MNYPQEPDQNPSPEGEIKERWNAINDQIGKLSAMGMPTQDIQEAISNLLEELTSNLTKNIPTAEQQAQKDKLEEGAEQLKKFIFDPLRLTQHQSPLDLFREIHHQNGSHHISDPDIVSYLIRKGAQKCNLSLAQLEAYSREGYFHLNKMNAGYRLPDMQWVLITSDEKILYATANNPEGPAVTLTHIVESQH